MLKVYNGTETVEGLSVKLSTETYTDYDFVLNTADETFRLPLFDGSEDLPSDRYDDLELLASDSPYTAPANGWYSIAGLGRQVRLWNSKVGNGGGAYTSDFANMVSVPVKKGDTVFLQYETCSISNSWCYFRFTYAQGNGSLYYYVGETVQNANLIDAGRLGEQLANKQDKCIHITETYQNGASWYRVYSDGWCEQGGEIPATTTAVVTKTATLYPSFVNTNYFAVGTTVKHTTYAGVSNKTTSSVSFYSQTSGGNLKEGILWFACGYIK